jgi:transposase
MTIVAHFYPFVIGVDTHAKTHTLAIMAASGEQVDTRQFPTTTAGMRRAIDWASRRTGGDLDTLWAIEGVGSYGAQFAAHVDQAGYQLIEAPRTDPRARHSIGKSDPIDARQIATAALATGMDRLRQPRDAHGIRAALRVLATARDDMTRERTSHINALTALLRIVDLGIDARKPLTGAQITTIAGWRTRQEPIAVATARAEAIRLAKRAADLDQQIKTNQTTITSLIRQTKAAPLMNKTGIGPITAATMLIAWSHAGRVRNEAAFAAIAGVSPLPASSGNTTRHRLNRGGDRRLNHALHMAVITRMAHDPDTQAYVVKRQAEGLTLREIRRILKRYPCRQIYRTLNTLYTGQPTTA